MGKISNYAAPKDVQREALKWLANNNSGYCDQIRAGITYSASTRLWNLPQNLSVLKKNKLATRSKNGLWTITQAGRMQGQTWMVIDGDIPAVTEPTEPKYRWEIVSVVLASSAPTNTAMTEDWEPFATAISGNNHYAYFRRLVEKTDG